MIGTQINTLSPTESHHTHTHTHSTKANQHIDGGSLPVELAPTFLGCVLAGTGPMGGQGLLGISETVEYMRGCIISHL